MNAPGSFGEVQSIRRPKSVPLVVLAIFLLETLIIGGILMLRNYEHKTEQALRDMYQLKTQIARLHNLEWRAIAAERIGPEIERGIRETEEAMASTLTRLFLFGEEDKSLLKMLSLYKVYDMTREGEFTLIKEGKFERARRIDIEQKDPAFMALRANLDQTIAHHTRRADRVSKLVDAFTFILFLFSGFFIAILIIKAKKILEKYNLINLEHRLRKEAEADQARLFEAIESSTDAVLIASKEGRIEYANGAFEKMTGYSREEVLGEHLDILGTNGGCQEPYSRILARLGPDLHWSGRLSNKKKNGEPFSSEDTIAAVSNSPETGYVLIKRDLTEKLKLESIAEAVNTMNNIGYVFSGIRHEIGNPINSIKANLGIIKMKLEKGDFDIAENIGRSQSELSRIEYLLRALKNFNMYESPEPREIEIKSFMDGFSKLMSEDFGRKGIRLLREYEEGCRYMRADPRALQQVLLNIAANAADSVEETEKPQILLTVGADSDMVRISIKDNGKGMSEEQKRELFKPFYTTKPHGTGLGLVLSKKMLSGMRGYMHIESAPGQGTRVDIFIPKK